MFVNYLTDHHDYNIEYMNVNMKILTFCILFWFFMAKFFVTKVQKKETPFLERAVAFFWHSISING